MWRRLISTDVSCSPERWKEKIFAGPKGKQEKEKRKETTKKEEKERKRKKEKREVKRKIYKKGERKNTKKGKVTPDRSYPGRNAASAGFISLNALSFNGKGGGRKREKKKGAGKKMTTHTLLSPTQHSSIMQRKH